VVDGNPLDDVKVLLEPQRIELVLKGGVVCVDRRAAPVPL
jgi:imidazolonepropionase-like amidohydrolase